MKATQLLIQEHKLILRSLDILDAMSAAVGETGTLEESDVDKILDFLRWFADAHHQAKEETILFPALRAAAKSQEPAVKHMTLEHDQDRTLIEQMERDLRLAKIAEFVTGAQRLSSALRNHIYKEDQILFETADRLLTPSEDETVFQLLRSFDTELDKQALENRLNDLRSLEWKYLRK